MFVPLIPSSIDHFRERRIIVRAFQIHLVDWFCGRLRLVGWTGERIIGIEVDGFGSVGFGRLGGSGGVVEQDAIVGAEGLVDYEVVEIIVLWNGSVTCLQILKMQYLRGV